MEEQNTPRKIPLETIDPLFTVSDPASDARRAEARPSELRWVQYIPHFPDLQFPRRGNRRPYTISIMYRLLSCLVLLAAAGFSQTAPAARPASNTTKKAAGGHSASDDVQLERLIRAKLAASKISKNKFEVHVQGGVATITGKTDVLQHKGTATRLAKNAGATQVVNKVEVSDAAKDKAASNLSSGGRRAQVKRSEVPDRN
jgi:BON domain-containing protein